jgi:hypothetical protein
MTSITNSSTRLVASIAGVAVAAALIVGAFAAAPAQAAALSQSQINAHFTAMTGMTPSGSCGQTCTAVTVQ